MLLKSVTQQQRWWVSWDFERIVLLNLGLLHHTSSDKLRFSVYQRQQAFQCRQWWNSLKSDLSRPEPSSGPNARWEKERGCGPSLADPADAHWVITPSSGSMFAFPTCRFDRDHVWLLRSKDVVFFFLILMNTFKLRLGKKWQPQTPNKHFLKKKNTTSQQKGGLHIQQPGASAPLNLLIHHREIELFYAKMAEYHQPLVYGSTTGWLRSK